MLTKISLMIKKELVEYRLKMKYKIGVPNQSAVYIM
jgi:hypothetical protein